MTTQANPWDYFNRLYCISLEEREDRRRSAREEFAKVGLADKVDFVIVQKHPTDVMQGMYESHMACLRKGLEAGAQNIVIFEDDICFERFDPRRLKSCVEFLKQNQQWKVFLFGALISASRKTVNSCVQKVRYQSLAHAYALNRDYAQKLAYVPWQSIVNDTLFCPLKDDVYAAYPMFAFQKDFSSDNYEYRNLERFRKMLGGLRRIQKGIEFYRRHMISIYAVQIVFLLLVVIFLFYR